MRRPHQQRSRSRTARPNEYPQIDPCPKHAADGSIQPCDDDIWKRIRRTHNPKNVFLNIPYIPQYRARKHLLIGFLAHLGLKPILAAAAIREQSLRICKLCELVQTCTFCISDISYVGLHNMPMEIGLILALGRRNIILFGGPKMSNTKRGRVKTILARMSNLGTYVDEVVSCTPTSLKGG